MSKEKIKNSLKVGSDKDGYFGEYGGIAVGADTAQSRTSGIVVSLMSIPLVLMSGISIEISGN